MKNTLLEIHEAHGEGYQPLLESGDWRVAILHFMEDLQPGRLASMERHNATDEVFVLLHGRGVLIIGGNGLQVDDLSLEMMEHKKVYNVKRNTWHTILLSRDASVLLVENRDTSERNSETTSLSAYFRQSIIEKAPLELKKALISTNIQKGLQHD